MEKTNLRLLDSYSSLNINRVTARETMRCVGYGARVGVTKIAYSILVYKSARKRPLPRHCIDGRVTSKAVLEDILNGLDASGIGYVPVEPQHKTTSFLVSRFVWFQLVSFLFGRRRRYVKGIFIVQKTVKK
jgi:hypothetical protein